MTSSPRIPAPAKVLFLLTALAAVASVVLSGSTLPGPASWAWWFAALAVPVLYRFPVVVTRGSRGIEIGFESVVAIFLAFAVPEHALMLWTVGWALAQVPWPVGRPLRRTPPWITLHNVAMTVLGGAATVWVVTHLVDGALRPGPWALVAVVLGATAYFLVDYALSAVALPLLKRASFREAWLYDDLSVTLACYSGVASLGYLGAVVLRADQWALPLLAFPLATFVIASRSYARASLERSRVTALLAVASRLHHATTPQQAEQIVLEEGRHAMRAEELFLRQDPGDALIRSAVVSDTGQAWLVPAPRHSSDQFGPGDQPTLDLLASLTADTLNRLSLHHDLAALASQDTLTGLANRATLQAALETALVASDGRPTAILFCDLDGFKAVNDRHGHAVGDELLTVVAERMRQSVRDGDLVARVGGDEFVVLLPRTTHEAALRVADRILEAVRLPSDLSTGPARVGISIGAVLSGPAATADGLLRRADAAMYLAKAEGKDQVRVAESVGPLGD
ncbi:GGDEF domain-containing protein [Actinotalea sp. K2]|uniref:GGDEF domain-containing protein n=1 Tax=Actinotalea sp. K2 TaxID=2939438 RepID=UPI002017C5A6|nr:GGDEF domain-containing protein [Actinotalea sp. K2]MCL3861644.1 GGDEF domain-containing protein [Actinotalea sp. K2]